jgi:hypothetical protein
MPTLDDEGHAHDKVSVRVYQHAGLLSQTRTLANLAEHEPNESKRVALTTATFLVAAAAMEALATEVAYVRNPALYAEGRSRYSSPLVKIRLLTGADSADCELIWSTRKAIAHSEPDNRRSRDVGALLQADGVLRVVAATERVFELVLAGRELEYGAAP